ncbi:MAG TPA: protease modulator HflK N-terminal domain-containing protein, partial [Rhodocyclaceae bacterium]|nr:protease modulator HflK N-terminal domain-containing protein [Rhodocyclaceae bacterium]
MSLNDPQWGNRGGNDGGDSGGPKRPNQGPPDLEELWRDLNRKLAGLFGKKGGGNGGGDGPRMPQIDFNPKFLGGGLGLLAGLIAVVWLASGFYIVDQSQRGVVLRFGSFKETTEPGLRWRFPYPVESHELVNLSGVRTVEIG